ncbi:MAG: hypothetical protein ACJ75J_03100 [Cytophagaceae bacterium]
MPIDYTLILIELKKKLTAAEAEKDTLLKSGSEQNKLRIRQLDEIIDSIKTQMRLLQ